VAIPSGQLSTYEYTQFTRGQQWEDPNGAIGAKFVGDAKPLNVADLACPTFGLGIGSRSGRPYTTVGPPYLPLIIPPPQVLSLDPQWQKACNGFLSYAPGMLSFAIYDPPRTLVPASALAPGPAGTPGITPAAVTTSNSPAFTIPAQPAHIPSSSLPDPTGDAHVAPDPQNAPSKDPKTPGQRPADSNGESPPQMSSIHQALGPAPAASPQSQPAAQPNKPAPLGINLNTQPKDPGIDASALIASPGVPTTPMAAPANADPLSHDQIKTRVSIGSGDPSLSFQPKQGDAPQEASQGLGEIIFSALGAGAPKEKSPPPVFTVADQTFTANPTGFPVAGSQVLPNHAPVVNSGTSISLDPSGVLIIGSSTTRLLAPTLDSNIDSPRIMTFAGQTFTANPTGLQVAGSQVLPGHAPVMLSGTSISLDSSAVLIVGSLSTHLPAPTPAPNIGIVGGQTFTANPTGFLLAGTSLLPGGQGITVSGTQISLAKSGILVVRSSTI